MRDISRATRCLILFLVIFFSQVAIAALTIRLSTILLLIFAMVALFLGLFGNYFVEKIGGWYGGFLSGWSSSKVDAREALSVELAKARDKRREARFDEALRIVSRVLKEDSEYPEALYLKATILWEGYDDGEAAVGYLKKVMELKGVDNYLLRRARDCRDEILDYSSLADEITRLVSRADGKPKN